MKPIISVVIAYYDKRRHPQNIRTFIKNQTLPPENFEIIVVAHAGTKVEPEVNKLLRSQDRLIRSDKDGAFSLYRAGAAAARGDILFFSEDHCLAQPGCLEAVERFFHNSELQAATMRWRCISRNAFARAEEKLNDIDRAFIESQPGDWNTVRIRGFAIKRHVYEGVGGFNEESRILAEHVIAARLHEFGYKVGLIPEIGIHHINSANLQELYNEVFDLGWSEAKYCSENESSQYFDSYRILMRDRILPTAVSQWLAVAIAKSIVAEIKTSSVLQFAKSKHSGAWLKEIVRLVVCNTTGLFVERLSAQLHFMIAWLRLSYLKFDENHSASAFFDLWNAMLQLGRIEFIAKSGVRARLKGAARFEAENAANAIGMNRVEYCRGKAFRWTTLASTFSIDTPVSDQIVTIDTGNVVNEKYCDRVSRFFWNDYLIPEDHVEFVNGKLHLLIKRETCYHGKDQRLTIISKPHHQSAAETRKLGLPVCSISVGLTDDKVPDNINYDSYTAPETKEFAQSPH